MRKQYHLTQSGVRELKAELKRLLAQRGPIAEQIKTAREFGDLAENAEYIASRQEQEKVESRITEIENILRNATIIKKPKSRGRVTLGSIIKLKRQGRSKKFQVVGTVEADPLKGKISNESPIGQALLNKREGDEVTIRTSVETTVYRVVYIS